VSTQLIMKITAAGYAAAANQSNTGIRLDLTHFQFGSGNRTPDGSELALISPQQFSAITDGQNLPVTGKLQLRMSALFEGISAYPISEIGIWAGEPGTPGAVLFSYWSKANGKVADMSVGVDFFYTHDMLVEAALGDALNIVIDPSASTAVALMTSHTQAADPHTQYWNDTRGGAKIQAAITALVGGAPGALDTLKELADAINDDANFAATVTTQLAARPAIYSITALPNTNKGPIIVAETAEVWLWSTSAYFTGYRSPLCGRPVDGHTLTPLVSEFDAIGGLLSKTAYAAVWGYAQENSLVLTQANWTTNIGGHYFVDVDANNFRSPDLRNMFRRFTGTDADTANATTLGSTKADTAQGHKHRLSTQQNTTSGTTTGGYIVDGPNFYDATYSTAGAMVSDGANGTPRIGKETAPKRVAYAPRIHA